MAKLRVIFIGQNGSLTTRPLHAVSGAHAIVGIVESAPRNWKPSPDGPSKHAVRRMLGYARRRVTRPPAPYKSVLQTISETTRVPFFFLTRTSTESLNDFVRDLRPDVICVASMSQLLRETTYNIAELGAINLHPSPLPKYRGPNPWFWQYYNMEAAGGMTIHQMDPGEDTGDILAQETFPVELGLPFALLAERAIPIGSKLMVATLDDLASGRGHRRAQPQHVSYPRARNVKRDEKLVDWQQWPLERVWHVMRGTGEWLDAIPPPGGSHSGLRWQIGEMSRTPVSVAPGTFAKDRFGYYAAHPQGKIRLTLDVSGSSRIAYYRFIVAGF